MQELMTRRQAIVAGSKTALATAAVGAVALSTEGCNADQWIQTALNDLPVVVQIAESIINIVGATKGGASPAALAAATAAADKAKAALVEAQNFIAQYKQNKTNTLLGNIDDAFTTASSQLSSIFGVFNLSDSTLQATIAAALGSAITIITAIQALVPPPPAATASRKAMANSNSQAFSISVAYNRVLSGAGRGTTFSKAAMVPNQ